MSRLDHDDGFGVQPSKKRIRTKGKRGERLAGCLHYVITRRSIQSTVSGGVQDMVALLPTHGRPLARRLTLVHKRSSERSTGGEGDCLASRIWIWPVHNGRSGRKPEHRPRSGIWRRIARSAAPLKQSLPAKSKTPSPGTGSGCATWLAASLSFSAAGFASTCTRCPLLWQR